MIPKEAQVVNAFNEYRKSGDKSKIENFTREEIQYTLVKKNILPDRDHALYLIMTDRIEDLKNRDKEKRENKEKWKDRIYGFVSGVIITLFGKWLATNIF